ncbi:uncharacterized protein Z518_05142 [Rhinocladiella mackenziei CBS 650.93]|uniref:Proteasome maturation factor UMP1 n=1 Tax=Rhinocladiella mackenziei CBS 650.93 TaxID=1442369 RepID=A0A0D2J5G3_9EURO|nr:uncharacterized protein Z518_05142 [Rhinocladiella mackenziei CBS 650.93]KIX04275.1 hypothetical protein Z518_05142 [Rhinocladiella mackenziei CBS 650.93]
MSLRIAPASGHPVSTSNTSTNKLLPSNKSNDQTTPDRGAPSAPGLPDTLRSSHAHDNGIKSTHPLETRLANWTATQESTRMNLLRRNFGIAEPLRRGMELKMVREADSFRPSVLGAPSRVHEEILTGRDTEITWEDVYQGQDGLRGAMDRGIGEIGAGWLDEIEKKVGMGKW